MDKIFYKFTDRVVMTGFIVIVTLTLTYSCRMSSDSGSGSKGSGSGVAYANMIVSDASGELGKGTFADRLTMTIYSSTGYLYAIHYDGSFVPVQIFFSGTACSGTPYDNEAVKTGKYVVYNGYTGKLYKPKNINSNGTATTTTVTTNSQAYLTGGYVDATNTGTFTELEETDRATVGIPSTITAPITLSFQ